MKSRRLRPLSRISNFSSLDEILENAQGWIASRSGKKLKFNRRSWVKLAKWFSEISKISFRDKSRRSSFWREFTFLIIKTKILYLFGYLKKSAYLIYASAWTFTQTATEFCETAFQFLTSPCLRLRLGQTFVLISDCRAFYMVLKKCNFCNTSG